MKFNLCAFIIAVFVTEIQGVDIFTSIFQKIDRSLLGIFDYTVHRVELYVRANKALNNRLKFLGTTIENLDDTWASYSKWMINLPQESYDPKQLAHDNNFLELAKFAKYGLYTEYSDQYRLIYHFGMRNSWNYFVALDSLLDVIFEQRIHENNPELTDTFLTSDFLTVEDLKNFMAWRGVSGSDDIEWVGIGLVAAYKFTNNKVFLDKDYAWNGARGCKQLYDEIYADFYDLQNGGIYWDSNQHYKGSISNSLWVLWSAEMYQATGEKKYLDEALKVQDWLINKGAVVLQDGTVYDGFVGKINDGSHLTKDVWSYNFGTFVGSVSEFHKITGNITYMKTGQNVIDNAFSRFNKTGYFTEDKKLDSDGDAFKGIFFKYVSKFLVQYWNIAKDQETKDWILNMKAYIIRQAKVVVYHKMTDDGLFSAYWSPKEEMKLTPVAQVSALDLFLAAHRVHVYIK